MLLSFAVVNLVGIAMAWLLFATASRGLQDDGGFHFEPGCDDTEFSAVSLSAIPLQVDDRHPIAA